MPWETVAASKTATMPPVRRNCRIYLRQSCSRRHRATVLFQVHRPRSRCSPGVYSSLPHKFRTLTLCCPGFPLPRDLPLPRSPILFLRQSAVANHRLPLAEWPAIRDALQHPTRVCQVSFRRPSIRTWRRRRPASLDLTSTWPEPGASAPAAACWAATAPPCRATRPKP